jgi:hypothetical protein
MKVINESVEVGNLTEVMLPTKTPFLKTSDEYLESFLNNSSLEGLMSAKPSKSNNRKKKGKPSSSPAVPQPATSNNILFRIPYHSASHSFELTRTFWNYAYIQARKTHPIPCSLFQTTDPYKLHIGIHIRHGDVLEYAEQGKERLTKLRFLPMEYFVQVLETLFEVVDRKRAIINVFSDGKWEDFHLLLDRYPETHLILGGDPIKALHHLAASDVLVGSKSGFTQIAVLVGAGGGLGVKLLPDVPWPSYAGFDNVLKIPTEAEPEVGKKELEGADGSSYRLWANHTVRDMMKTELRIGLALMTKRYHDSPNTAWTCKRRSAEVVIKAVKECLLPSS